MIRCQGCGAEANGARFESKDFTKAKIRYWKVTESNPIHTQNCIAPTHSNVSLNVLRNDPEAQRILNNMKGISAVSVQNQLQSHYSGNAPSAWNVNLARREMKNEKSSINRHMYGDMNSKEVAWNSIEPYLTQLKEMNPSVEILFETDSENRFQCLGVRFPEVGDIVEFAMNVASSADAMFIKNEGNTFIEVSLHAKLSDQRYVCFHSIVLSSMTTQIILYLIPKLSCYLFITPSL